MRVCFLMAAFVICTAYGRCNAQSLIAYWNFDETSGTTAFDSAGSNDGTLLNNAVGGDLPTWKPTSGKFGGAIRFDALTSDYVQIPDFNYGDSGNFTTSIWTKAETNVAIPDSRFQYFWSTGNYRETGSFNYYFVSEWDTNGNPGTNVPGEYKTRIVDDNGIDIGNFAFPGSPQGGDWRMLTVTYSTTVGMEYYLDGAFVGSKPSIVGPVGSSGKDMFFGVRSDLSDIRRYGSTDATDPDQELGLLDDAAIWDFTLSPEEIMTVFENGAASVGGPVGLSGDFDGDDDVDGADFLEWQRGESPNGATAGDLADWETNFGMVTAIATVNAVPEPSSWLLACTIAMTISAGLRRCPRRRKSALLRSMN